MTAERDIAGFVLPFACGAALITASEHLLSSSFPHLLNAALLLTVTSLCFLMHNNHKCLSTCILWALIITTGAGCGILCAGLEAWFPTYATGHPGQIAETAADFAENIKLQIASVTFEDSRTNAVITALITGDRNGLEDEISGIFRKSGASHILALSGMHLGIIYGILKAALYALGNTRAAKTFRSILTVIICGFYTLSTGAGASIVRAFIFILLTETAGLTGRNADGKTILFSALLIQLVLAPDDIWNVGFQLSYAAVGGIVFIYPHLQKLWTDDRLNEGWTSKFLRWIWNCATLSVSCQITTGPIAYAYFGTFPLYFLITNLLAIPLVTLIIPAGLLTIAMNTCGICPEFLIHETESLVDALRYSLTVISSL